MANVIIVVALILIGIYGVKSYMKSVAHGCCGTGNDEKRIRVKDKRTEHYPYAVTLSVDGMTCSNCKMRVENALNAEEGVWAEVSLKEKKAVVRMKERIEDAVLKRDVERAGYDVLGISEGVQ